MCYACGKSGGFLLTVYLLCQLGGEEVAQAHVEHDAEANELVRPHLTLPVEYVPEPLAVDGGAPPELGDAYAPLVADLLDSYGYQLCMVQKILRLRSVVSESRGCIAPSGRSVMTPPKLSVLLLPANAFAPASELLFPIWERRSSRDDNRWRSPRFLFSVSAVETEAIPETDET